MRRRGSTALAYAGVLSWAGEVKVRCRSASTRAAATVAVRTRLRCTSSRSAAADRTYSVAPLKQAAASTPSPASKLSTLGDTRRDPSDGESGNRPCITAISIGRVREKLDPETQTTIPDPV